MPAGVEASDLAGEQVLDEAGDGELALGRDLADGVEDDVLLPKDRSEALCLVIDHPIGAQRLDESDIA